MIITGSITNAGQMSPKDRNGNTYQDIVIQNNDGYEYTGRIGSKNGYAAGTPIQVTSEERADGTLYFRKYNPQYPQGQPAPRQQAPQQQAPRQQAPPQQVQNVYTYPDAKDIGIVRQCCIKAAARLHQANTATEAIAAAQQFEDWVFGRTTAMQPEGPSPLDNMPINPNENEPAPF